MTYKRYFLALLVYLVLRFPTEIGACICTESKAEGNWEKLKGMLKDVKEMNNGKIRPDIHMTDVEHEFKRFCDTRGSWWEVSLQDGKCGLYFKRPFGEEKAFHPLDPEKVKEECYIRFSEKYEEILKAESVLLNEKQFYKAREMFEQINARYPENPSPLVWLGYIAVFLESSDKGLYYYDRILKDYPRHTKAHACKALIYRKFGPNDKAMAEVRTNRELDPSFAFTQAEVVQSLERRLDISYLEIDP